MSKTLLLITGPSGVGKRPLVEALRTRLPDMIEVPVHIKSTVGGVLPGMRQLGTDELAAVNPDRQVRVDVRGEPNVVDLDELKQSCREHAVVVMVVHFTLAQEIKRHARFVELMRQDLRVLTACISPFSEEELRACMYPEQVVLPIMLGRQLERTLAEALRGKQLVQASATVGAMLRNVSAWQEIQARRYVDHVLVMRNGYLPSTWASNPPAGEAGCVLQELAHLAVGGD